MGESTTSNWPSSQHLVVDFDRSGSETARHIEAPEFAGSDEIDTYSGTSLLREDRPVKSVRSFLLERARSPRNKPENGGEALRRIDTVLRQLHTASRSHRLLLEERYNELTSGMRSLQERHQARAVKARMVTPRKVDRQRLVDYLTTSEQHRRFLDFDESDGDQELRELSWRRSRQNNSRSGASSSVVYHVH